ncbi:helix-turn-helix domain-containing protein [Marinimicrobium sp. C6131]|uniref:helix-turn-helix transcriptional regulator n=1 Tax=Marinimicrobium sp. C6131 TaxID=3022676 RepID=UPI00223D2E83|nr:helix-turn-helix transcriptional regulator [Marinimicrobium sp. C6131]UZJ43107.1 helix-turn-helix domain-containing protein [Marinimicrobium sp. C6131]
MPLSLMEQIKRRRLALGLKQKDMAPRLGMVRQQYQHLESRGNPRLETLELVAAGLNSELMLIPQEKLNEVKAVLENNEHAGGPAPDESAQRVLNDPWKGFLGDES